MITIAAVVATHNRPEMLEKRSLASIVRQRRPPDYLLVVDDSDISIRPVNAEAVATTMIEGTQVIYLENLRTDGASGAWTRPRPTCKVSPHRPSWRSWTMTTPGLRRIWGSAKRKF